MQASKITLGNEYAVAYDKKIHRFRATEITTQKSLHGTTNLIGGYINGVTDDDGKPKLIRFEVARILDEANKYEHLQAEKQREADAAKAKEDARLARLHKAGQLLGKAIGVHAIVNGYGDRTSEDKAAERGPRIEAYYNRVEVSEQALDQLIEYFEKQGVTL